MSKLIVSPSPHITSAESTSRIMLDVIIALIPAFIVSIIFFGLNSIIVTVTAILACLFFEYIIQKYMMKVKVTISDYSALLTGLLLAFNLPANYPIWMTIVGSFVAIAVAKISFGGIGNNLFNPALVGRVFLLISFPVATTLWPRPTFLNFSVDAETGPTILSVLKESIGNGQTVNDVMGAYNYADLFLGKTGGSLGEISALALLIGGIYLLYRRVITWHIPVSFLATVALCATAFWFYNSNIYAPPHFHLVTGGVVLGALFMATDMVTSPMSSKGQLIFGAGCGLLTILIRLFGAYPEGVSFAILIMNAVVPLIDKMCKPKRYGF